MTPSIINLDVIGFPPYGYKLYQQCSLRFSFAVNFQDMILNSEEIWGKPPEHLHGFLIGSFPAISLTAMGWVSAFLWPWRDGNVRSFSLWASQWSCIYSRYIWPDCYIPQEFSEMKRQRANSSVFYLGSMKQKGLLVSSEEMQMLQDSPQHSFLSPIRNKHYVT